MADGERSGFLKIALVSTCAVATPPAKYGGTELVVAELANRLFELGHQVTVFATGDSTCRGAVRSLFDRPIWPPNDLAELRHATAAWQRIAKEHFDVVHVHHAEALPFTRFVGMPTIATVHHEHVDSIGEHYAHFSEVAFVAISRRQAELSPEVPFRSVIHHGVDPALYPLGKGGDYCAFLGRFAPTKAPHLAIDLARRAGVPLRLGGEAHSVDRAYFETEVEPRFGDDAQWLGELDLPRKIELLGNARCLLFPIQWEEPFGLVMIESMLVGTPVIALARGSAPEVVEDGVTGYVVDTIADMEKRLRDVEHIDRVRCRERARERFSSSRMARDYAALYRQAALAKEARWHA